jgi:hypothetical protein
MERPPRVVLSYGLGADSTAILLRWLTEPGSRDFELADLLVITAMTGDEWPIHRRLVETHVLPLLARHGVRYAQVARRGPSQTDGVAVLDDSRRPARLYVEGAYTLAEEMLSTGTVPQTGGARLCSAKSKGWPADTFLAGATGGRPYRHVMGFEVGEAGRAKRDAAHDTARRTGEYPLITWGWDRAACLAYIRDLLGVDWPKSACRFCPFALDNQLNRERVLAGFAGDPDTALTPLLMEYVAVALNPAQGLIGGRRLLNLIAARPELAHVIDAHTSQLDHMPWAVYEVRRVLRPRRTDPAKLGNAVRSVRRRFTGSRAAARAELAAIARRHGGYVDAGDGHGRVWLRRRALTLPTAERFFVAAPATVADKDGPGFEAAWAALLDAPDGPTQELLNVA